MSKPGEFVHELHKGYEYQLAVAVAFLREGFAVQTEKLRVRPEPGAKGFSDTFDLLVFHPDGTPLHMEVKSRSIVFSDPEDFPFDTVITETSRSYGNRGFLPSYYLFISQKTGSIIGLPSAGKDSWSEEWITDKRRGRRERYIVAPSDQLVSFKHIVRDLSSKKTVSVPVDLQHRAG